MRHVWCVALCLWFGAAGSAGAQSIWSASAGSLYADHRARAVNDIVTIVIGESSESKRSAQTKTSKESSIEAGLDRFPDAVIRLENLLMKLFRIKASGKSAYEGKGNIDRSDTVTATITARVVKVLENGNLLIEGRRAVAVNDETQYLVLSGVIRPQDVSIDNTISSTKVADAEIHMEGSGILAEKQRPGILQRVLDWLWLF